MAASGAFTEAPANSWTLRGVAHCTGVREVAGVQLRRLATGFRFLNIPKPQAMCGDLRLEASGYETQYVLGQMIEVTV